MMLKILLVFSIFISVGFSKEAEKCRELHRKLGLIGAAQRLAEDPVALLKGRDSNISEGILVKKWDPKLKTTFYHTASEPNPDGSIPLVDPQAKAIALFFHGSGTAKSSGRNFIHNMNWLSQQGIAGVSIDLPFHATNKGEDRLNQKAEFMKWMREVVSELKKSGKPIYLVGHSFGPEIALQYASEFPKDLKGGGLFLISGAWGKSPSHEWMYEKVTTPGMEFIGGDQKVEDNPAGGDWAGRMAEQSDWHLRGISPEVKVKLVVGEKDEWWPPAGPGDKLPRGVKRIKPALPYPNQLGNEGLMKKLGINPEHTLNESLEWTREKIPHVDIDLVEGFGHFIFESRDQRGGPLLNRLLLDFAEIEYSKNAEQNKKSPRLELKLLAENSKIFRDWVGERNLPLVLKDETSAERVLEQWRSLEFLTWKELFSQMKETDPEYYEKRKYWLAKELKDMPQDLTEFKRRNWNGNEILADLKKYREAKESQQKISLSEDPFAPKLPVISSSLLGESAQATPYGGSIWSKEFLESLREKGTIKSDEILPSSLRKIVYDYKGNEGKVWFALEAESPERVKEFLQRAFEEAYRRNGNISPGDNWEAVIDGIRVKASNRLDHKNKMYRLEKVSLEPAN